MLLYAEVGVCLGSYIFLINAYLGSYLLYFDKLQKQDMTIRNTDQRLTFRF